MKPLAEYGPRELWRLLGVASRQLEDCCKTLREFDGAMQRELHKQNWERSEQFWEQHRPTTDEREAIKLKHAFEAEPWRAEIARAWSRYADAMGSIPDLIRWCH